MLRMTKRFQNTQMVMAKLVADLANRKVLHAAATKHTRDNADCFERRLLERYI